MVESPCAYFCKFSIRLQAKKLHNNKVSLSLSRYSYADMHRVRKLIELDREARDEVRQIHYSNLWEMVNYCENTRY